MNVAINGFGRIGRAVFKILNDKKSQIKIVAINDLTDPATLAHLLKYDTCYGVYPQKIAIKNDILVVGDRKVKLLAEKNPEQLPWESMNVDVVLECTGRFRTKEEASLHIKAGAKKVVISAPAKGGDAIKTIVLGVNEHELTKTDDIISNASCTTNCLAPVTDVIKQNFGIKKALMTTIHSYTADQRVVDSPHSDLRRARAAAANIVPTTTGAAKATTITIPSLKGKFDGMAVRVPVPVGSLCDIVFITNKKTTVQEVNTVLKKAAQSAKYKNIIEATNDMIVSSDIVGNSHSGIVDLECTKVVEGDMLKLIVWYDNEWGYSSRLVDLCEYILKKRLL